MGKTSQVGQTPSPSTQQRGNAAPQQRNAPSTGPGVPPTAPSVQPMTTGRILFLSLHTLLFFYSVGITFVKAVTLIDGSSDAATWCRVKHLWDYNASSLWVDLGRLGVWVLYFLSVWFLDPKQSNAYKHISRFTLLGFVGTWALTIIFQGIHLWARKSDETLLFSRRYWHETAVECPWLLREWGDDNYYERIEFTAKSDAFIWVTAFLLLVAFFVALFLWAQYLAKSGRDVDWAGWFFPAG